VSPHRASAGFTDRWDHFRFELADGIATVTFDRPDRLNALTFEAYADLRDLLAELPHREDARVLVITGTGRGFCSGGDVEDIIGALQKADARDLLDFTRMTGAVVQRMRECPLPIIASVNGVAAGAGSVIAMAADFRIVARSASFAFLFTKVGLAGSDMGSAYLLPRLVGLGRATELLMLGESVSAERAVEIGLAGQVVDDEELAGATAGLAERLSAGPGFALAGTKLLLSREQDLDLAGSLELEAMTQALLMTSADHHEFYRAFTEGRDPKWTGR
jgi:enoyl-CoA hydratase/carnithine racemase